MLPWRLGANDTPNRTYVLGAVLPESFRLSLERLLGGSGVLISSLCDLGLSGHFLVHKLTLISFPLLQTDPGEPSGLTVNLRQAPENFKPAHKLEFLLRQVTGSEPEQARVSGGSFSAPSIPWEGKRGIRFWKTTVSESYWKGLCGMSCTYSIGMLTGVFTVCLPSNSIFV